MALPASRNVANDSLAYGEQNLVPLRINVVSDSREVTIVDTLVLDRTCWPIPLYLPLEECLEKNADLLAYTLITDMEVYGMGRTVRHFTNRNDFWTADLQNKIKEQLMPQLRHVAATTKLVIRKDPLYWEHRAKRQRMEEEEKEEKETTPKAKDEDNEEMQDEEAAEKLAENQLENDDKPDSATTLEHKNSTTTEEGPAEQIEVPAGPIKKAALVPVRLRLCVNGVRIHDDFIWDLSVDQCPIAFAQNLGKDLNLSDEAVVAVMTSIVEQLDGSTVEDTKDLVESSDATVVAKKNATAAWELEQREHVANVTQLLTLHRPGG